MVHKAKRCRPEQLEASPLSICDLVGDFETVRSALSRLESYANDDRQPLSRPIRVRHVRYIVGEMVSKYGIKRDSPEFVLVVDFYRRLFNEDAESYIIEDSTLRLTN